MMETDEETGVKYQFFPMTHISAVLGLESIIAGQSKVVSVNGKIGAIVITKSDLGLENAITKLPYANESEDGIITTEMYKKILNSGEGDYVLPIAGVDKLGGIKLGDLLAIDEATGKLSAIKQTDNNFSTELKNKLDSLKNYTAGANISISNTGIISTPGFAEGGANQAYVDQKAAEAFQSAQAYTNSQIANIEPGKDGNNGKSAYEIAVGEGFQGTESQWLVSLKGKDGVNATTTEVATADKSGLMAKEDKQKLDTLQNYTFEEVAEV